RERRVRHPVVSGVQRRGRRCRSGDRSRAALGDLRDAVRQAPHRGHPRPRDERRAGDRRPAGLPRHLHAGDDARRHRRRDHRAHGFRRTRHGRGGDRPRLRRDRDRRTGEHARRGARRDHRRPRAFSRGALGAAGGAVQHLRGNGVRPGLPAARTVRRAGGEEDMKPLDRTVRRLGIALVALLAISPLLPDWALFLATVSLAKGLVALGLVLLMRTGLVSFGQGLYYALGAYTAGMAPRFFGAQDALFMVLAGTASAAMVGAVLGLLIARYRAIFFAMLSLAFSMILYGLLVKSPALGSTDGFNAGAQTVAGLPLTGMVARYALYVLALLCAFASAALLHRYLASHLGRLTPAVRDNELRVEYMGASVRNVVHLNLVLAS